MAINMPHEGGLEILSIIFGSKAPDENFRIFLIKDITGWDDNNTYASEVAGLYLASDYPADYVVDTLYKELITAAEIGLSPTAIGVVGGVPQVEFPEYKVTFTETATDIIYGYALVGAGSTGTNYGKIYFREQFPTAVSYAGKKLAFIPTLKIGNTTEPLT